MRLFSGKDKKVKEVYTVKNFKKQSRVCFPDFIG